MQHNPYHQNIGCIFCGMNLGILSIQFILLLHNFKYIYIYIHYFSCNAKKCQPYLNNFVIGYKFCMNSVGILLTQ